MEDFHYRSEIYNDYESPNIQSLMERKMNIKRKHKSP